MKKPTKQIPTISMPAVPRVEQSTITKHKNRKKRHKHTMSTAVLAHNTRYRTQKTKKPPARRTRAHTQVTRMENKKQKVKSSKVETTISQLENDIHQALAVMDAETGKLLNYRKLMRNPKYKKNWSTSSANEFGRLANGVVGLIKTRLTQSY